MFSPKYAWNKHPIVGSWINLEWSYETLEPFELVMGPKVILRQVNELKKSMSSKYKV